MKKEIPVLMYHQFVDKALKNSKVHTYVTAKQFDLQLRMLKLLGYETITFKDLNKIGLENRFKKKYIVLTVDDGYVNNYEFMLPILKKHNMKAVVYLVEGIKYNRWDVEKFGESEKLPIMETEMVKDLIRSGLIEIGGHTYTHPSLPKLTLEDKRKEIVESKKATEEKYGIKLVSFAYPYGHLDEESVQVVKEAGYKFAVSTDTGTGVFTDNLFDIRRSGIDKTTIFDFLRKISYKYSIYKGRKYSQKKERR
ncbi:polysaccharide deacetylase family protein [uncultured Cetobacterium sp.]|uniref:polysaccharide deacetylase family protein n=1 Tax=uncultured Cetobacterium sp. TaxID=527638 RepID=UPI0025E983EF|nr:polysaccharide deacetylase family protein [uncultured Cetobacterium sp.]